jgi:ketosteroid isomerase-like protein
MSQDKDVVVTPVEHGGPPSRSRTFDERLAVCFPSLFRRSAALVQRLSPRSRLKRALLRRGLVSGWAAHNRRDFKVMLVRYAPDVEFELARSIQPLGLGGVYHGHAGVVEALGKMAEAWDLTELEPAYVLDLGDRLLNLGFMRSHARASGVQLEQKFSQLITPYEGLVSRDQSFFSWEDGLRAAGLDPDAIVLPPRQRTAQALGGAG